jgi:aspartate aminotransferase
MKSISISTRAKETPASAIRKLVPFAEIAKKQGKTVYHVNIGQPDLPTPPEVLAEIKRLSLKTLEYAPSSGLPETIHAWGEFYRSKQYPLEDKDILVTAGGSEGLIFAFLTVCDPGDELIVFDPYYTSYAIIARMGDIILKPVMTSIKDGFHLPAKEVIEKAISKKTKGIVICNPNNPTGTVYTDEEVKMIVKIAKDHNLFIISDETYQEIVFDNKKVLPFINFPEIHNQLIICDSISKRFNACGARIGCVASKNEEVMQVILRFAQSRLSVATVEQLAIIPAFANWKSYTEKIKKAYESRRNTVVEGLGKIEGAEFMPPQGAFYIIPKLPIDNSDKFAEYLLKEFDDNKETLMVAPATGFYATPGKGLDEIRIAYVLEEKKLERAIELLGKAIKCYNS